jgi:hypothetical protein
MLAALVSPPSRPTDPPHAVPMLDSSCSMTPSWTASGTLASAREPAYVQALVMPGPSVNIRILRREHACWWQDASFTDHLPLWRDCYDVLIDRSALQARPRDVSAKQHPLMASDAHVDTPRPQTAVGFVAAFSGMAPASAGHRGEAVARVSSPRWSTRRHSKTRPCCTPKPSGW